MAAGPAFDHAVEVARDTPSLDVGAGIAAAQTRLDGIDVSSRALRRRAGSRADAAQTRASTGVGCTHRPRNPGPARRRRGTIDQLRRAARKANMKPQYSIVVP